MAREAKRVLPKLERLALPKVTVNGTVTETNRVATIAINRALIIVM